MDQILWSLHFVLSCERSPQLPVKNVGDAAGPRLLAGVWMDYLIGLPKSCLHSDMLRALGHRLFVH